MRRPTRKGTPRPYELRVTKVGMKRIYLRRYETERGARIGAAGLLSALYDGRAGYPQPVAHITGPAGVDIRLTKTRALMVDEL